MENNNLAKAKFDIGSTYDFALLKDCFTGTTWEKDFAQSKEEKYAMATKTGFLRPLHHYPPA